MAMIMRERSSELGSESRHHLHEIREARCDHAHVIDRDRIARTKTKREKRHGDAMVHMCRDEAAAFYASLPYDDEIVAFDARLDAARGKSCGSCREPIAFLHLQLREPFHARLALGIAGKASKHRI